ncbi:MAG TPA: flavodoxin domain-containing protein [Candidatus Krumholzibacterium sp.]|nr:flavodoxin domain-containing protein [Candidatus Krumholzibacterium sp.]
MKTIIVYMTKHGCTEKAAGALESLLSGPTTVVNLKDDKNPSFDQFDSVIIGGSIHVGQIQKKVRKFCEKNLDRLLEKRLGLYICCMETGEKAREEFDQAFDPRLREHASATGLFGGEFDFTRMNFLEKKIIQRVAEFTENVSRVDEDSIREFARMMEGVDQGTG